MNFGVWIAQMATERGLCDLVGLYVWVLECLERLGIDGNICGSMPRCTRTRFSGVKSNGVN